MLEFFKSHKKIILRTFGILMLVIAFVVHFWVVPKDKVTVDAIAAANVARMEASVAGSKGSSSTTGKPSPSSGSPFMEHINNTRQKQLEYFTILIMIFGAGFLVYSFIKKEDD